MTNLASPNPHLGPFEPFPHLPDIDAMNRMLRPAMIYALMFVGVLFLLGLGMIMLYRYATHGEIDWQGLAAFVTLVLFPIINHQNRRSTEKLAGVS